MDLAARMVITTHWLGRCGDHGQCESPETAPSKEKENGVTFYTVIVLI